MFFFLLISVLLCFTVHGSQPWPGPPGTEVTNIKAFPSNDPCRIEIVFERNETLYDYCVYGLYGDQKTPVLLQLTDFANDQRTNEPISVINGVHNDSEHLYNHLASSVRYTPIVENSCPPNQPGQFQNEIYITAVDQDSNEIWASDPVQIQGDPIPEGGVIITGTGSEKDVPYTPRPGFYSYTPSAGWAVKGFNSTKIDDFFLIFGYRYKGKMYIESINWTLRFMYHGPEDAGGYIPVWIPEDFDFDSDVYLAVCIHTFEGSFTDPKTCPQSTFKLRKP